MRLANLAGRSTIVTDAGLVDVATSSNGAFSSSIDKCITQLDKIRQWFDAAQPAPTDPTTPEELCSDARLGPVVTAPQQIFAVGVNYRKHAEEMGHTLPPAPMIFTKFVSSLAGANAEVTLPADTTDYEAELVVVIGEKARNVSVENALSIVAGYCVGQDYSERTLQRAGTPPQFSMGKSFANFAPIGPWLTTSDAIDPSNLTITCSVSDDQRQNSTTADMIFGVEEIISYLSNIVELRPGDLIFTGTPSGVGQGTNPPRFLKPGDRVVTEIEGLGRIENATV